MAASSSSTATTLFAKPADAAERFNLLRSVGEECISDEGLKNLAEKKPDIRCYDGFEPSGRMHIAQGLFKAANVNKCAASDCTFVFWVADWFALMNDKMGGDLASIQLVGKYFVEVWKAAGMDMSHVEFQWASEEITKNAVDYWTRVLDIGRRNTVNRIKKCCQIMGRSDGSLSAAQILYPLMQCADIFFLKADVCQLGVDQRKVNMLAREYCDQIGKKLKPVILSHHMLAGLKKGQGKMSKSDPDSAIFMEDPREEVHRKIMQAYCPVKALPDSKIDEEGATEADDDKNPCLEYIRYVLFSRPNPTFTVKTSESDKKTFTTFESIQDEFVNGNISETQLKEGLIDAINDLLEPIRQHFKKDADASKLLDDVRELRAKVAAAAAEKKAQEEQKEKEQDPAAASSSPAATTTKKPHAVAWLPCSIKVPLAQLFSIVQQLNNFLAANNGAEATLVLPDWTYFAQGVLRGELKDISAALEYHADICVKALGLNPAVKVVKQSTDLISKDPNKFWISAIGAGRKFKLSNIEGSVTTPVDQAGQVIASLMHCADVDCLEATTLIGNSSNEGHNKLAAEYVSGTRNIKCDFVSVGANLTNLPPENLCDPTTKPASANDWLFADENDNEIRKKIKQAYCAPGNTATPVLDIACFLIQHIQGKLLIERNEANGGNKEYTDAQSLISDFGSSTLHPGDLKASVSKGIAALYSSKIAPCVSGADQKKRATVLKNAEKKAAKN